MQSIMNSTKKFVTSPSGTMISGAVVASLPHIARLRPVLGVYSVPAAIIGMGLMAYAGLEKANQDAVKLSDKTKKDYEDVRIKTQAKWTPIEIDTLSDDNLKKMKNEKPLMPKAVKEKIDTQLEEIGNWKSNIGVNGISQTYQSALLYGPTGSGKSSVARQMIAKFDEKTKADGRTHYHIKIEPTMLSSEHGNAKLGKLLDDMKAKVSEKGTDKVAFSILMDECDGALKVGLETANQYNTMIDAFTKEMNVPILQILTTNHLDDIDARTIRLGRCGTKIEIPNPDRETKEKIMKQAINQFTINGQTMTDIAKNLDSVKRLFGLLAGQDGKNIIENLQNEVGNTASQEFNSILTVIKSKKVACQVFNPAIRKNEFQNKSLNDLLDDETISGATISEITLKMVKALTVKAQKNNPTNPLDALATAVVNNKRNPNKFISDYGVEKILAEAIGEALTQKALEENNKAKA